MEVTKWLKPSGSVSRIGEPRLPLWVNNGSPAWASECPELGVEQKSISDGWMSACSHKRTFEHFAATIDFRPHRRYNRAGRRMLWSAASQPYSPPTWSAIRA